MAESPRTTGSSPNPLPVEQDDEVNEPSYIDHILDGEPEKDGAELELERAIFGNKSGFRESLKQGGDGEEQGQRAVPPGLEELDDAELFFADTVGADATHGQLVIGKDQRRDDGLPSRLPPVWDDSDDERMLVSLASVPRLRKLRRTEGEDMVNGREYATRLRVQYELLTPRPDWARQVHEQPAYKKRRLSRLVDLDGGRAFLSEPEMDVDEPDMPSAAPLAELLHDAQALIRTRGRTAGQRRKLRAGVIDIQRAKDIAGAQASAVTSLSFHPELPLLLSSGPASTVYLHHVCPSPPASEPNPLLTSMHIRGMALSTTAFHPADSRIFLSARRRYFHVWNLETGQVEKVSRVYGQRHEQRSMERFILSPDGKYMALLGSAQKGGGVINILSALTLQWHGQIRIESHGGVADFGWWRNSKGLCVAGKSGEITEWSIVDKCLVARWQDEGAVGTTTLALGGQHELANSPIGTDRRVAVGSSSGIVNIYDRRAWHSENTSISKVAQVVPTHPKPIKTLDHLTTPTSHLAFSPDGQLLAMASKWKRDAMRLVHLPSCTVFKNWPTSATPLGRITALAWADGQQLGAEVYAVLAVANEQGRIRLWEIR